MAWADDFRRLTPYAVECDYCHVTNIVHFALGRGDSSFFCKNELCSSRSEDNKNMPIEFYVNRVIPASELKSE